MGEREHAAAGLYDHDLQVAMTPSERLGREIGIR